MAIEPSGWRCVSRTAATVRGQPMADPFTVWQIWVPFSPAFFHRTSARRAW